MQNYRNYSKILLLGFILSLCHSTELLKSPGLDYHFVAPAPVAHSRAPKPRPILRSRHTQLTERPSFAPSTPPLAPIYPASPASRFAPHAAQLAYAYAPAPVYAEPSFAQPPDVYGVTFAAAAPAQSLWSARRADDVYPTPRLGRQGLRLNSPLGYYRSAPKRAVLPTNVQTTYPALDNARPQMLMQAREDERKAEMDRLRRQQIMQTSQAGIEAEIAKIEARIRQLQLEIILEESDLGELEKELARNPGLADEMDIQLKYKKDFIERNATEITRLKTQIKQLRRPSSAATAIPFRETETLPDGEPWFL